MNKRVKRELERFIHWDRNRIVSDKFKKLETISQKINAYKINRLVKSKSITRDTDMNRRFANTVQKEQEKNDDKVNDSLRNYNKFTKESLDDYLNEIQKSIVQSPKTL